MKNQAAALNLINPDGDPVELIQNLRKGADIWASRVRVLAKSLHEAAKAPRESAQPASTPEGTSDDQSSAAPPTPTQDPKKMVREIREARIEIKELYNFIYGIMLKRLETIDTQEQDRKLKYLKVIEPYYTSEGLRQFISHYFDVETPKQKKELVYRKKDPFEKEVAILFSLYRVKKTIETIDTIQKELSSGTPFPSIFTKQEQEEFLKTLKEILKLFFIKFIKQEYIKGLYKELSENQLKPEELLKRKQQNISYVKQEILESSTVRNMFVLLFFATEMQTIVNKKPVKLHFNYLNFEIIKNEFLVDWLNRKLKGNKVKDKIFQEYKIGGKSIAQLIKENPEKEAEILQQIPMDLFNDMAEQVNDKVDDDLKSPISTFSKKFGQLANFESTFKKAKQIARFSVVKMQKVVAQITSKPKPKKKKVVKKKTEPVFKSKYELEVLVEADIDFPYFDSNPDTYQNKFNYLKKKMGNQYERFQGDVWKFFETVEDSQLIKRNLPVKEWVIPFQFVYEGDFHFLAIGAEITEQRLGMGYKSKWKDTSYEFNPYFVYGVKEQKAELGKLLGERMVQGAVYFIYSYAERGVQDKVLEFFNLVLQNKEGGIFPKSNLKYKVDKDDQQESQLKKEVTEIKEAGRLKREDDSETQAPQEEKEKKENRQPYRVGWEVTEKQKEELKKANVKLKI